MMKAPKISMVLIFPLKKSGRVRSTEVTETIKNTIVENFRTILDLSFFNIFK